MTLEYMLLKYNKYNHTLEVMRTLGANYLPHRATEFGISAHMYWSYFYDTIMIVTNVSFSDGKVNTQLLYTIYFQFTGRIQEWRDMALDTGSYHQADRMITIMESAHEFRRNILPDG